MRTRIASGLIALSTLGVPLIASAQKAANVEGGLFGLVNFANSILNNIMVVMITLAIVVFFWGLVKYIISDGEARSEGLRTIFYSIIAIFIMVSIWGVIKLLQNTFGVGGAASQKPAAVELYGPSNANGGQ
jgi:uncharacterized membrane protein